MDRVDRFLGSLVGLAVGDALGRPLEGMTAEEIRQHYGEVAHYVEVPPDQAERWCMPGLHSDDTQQALALTETILEAGRADPDVLGRKFLALARGPKVLPLGAHRGFGRNFQYTVAAWKRGCRWNGGGRNTAGIGASMRVAPVGLAFAGDDPAIRENATLQALVTHQDPRGIIAACVVAYLVGRALWTHPEKIVPEALLRDAVGFAERAQEWLHDVHRQHLAPETADTYPQFSKALAGLSGKLHEPPEVVLPFIARQAEEIAAYRLNHPCQGFALGGVIAAIYFALHQPGTFGEPVLRAIHAGGDTDSVGAITGAITGALTGYGAIPDAWKRDLVGREQIELRALALAGERYDESLWKDLASVELEWTLAEEEKRRQLTGRPPLTEEELADLEPITIRPIEKPARGEGRGGERAASRSRRRPQQEARAASSRGGSGGARRKAPRRRR
jgi:ADP-ribosylglycohydrolase